MSPRYSCRAMKPYYAPRTHQLTILPGHKVYGAGLEGPRGRAGGTTGAGPEEPLGQAGRAYQKALPDRPIALPAQEPLGLHGRARAYHFSYQTSKYIVS